MWTVDRGLLSPPRSIEKLQQASHDQIIESGVFDSSDHVERFVLPRTCCDSMIKREPSENQGRAIATSTLSIPLKRQIRKSTSLLLENSFICKASGSTSLEAATLASARHLTVTQTKTINSLCSENLPTSTRPESFLFRQSLQNVPSPLETPYHPGAMANPQIGFVDNPETPD